MYHRGVFFIAHVMFITWLLSDNRHRFAIMCISASHSSEFFLRSVGFHSLPQIHFFAFLSFLFARAFTRSSRLFWMKSWLLFCVKLDFNCLASCEILNLLNNTGNQVIIQDYSITKKFMVMLWNSYYPELEIRNVIVLLFELCRRETARI